MLAPCWHLSGVLGHLGAFFERSRAYLEAVFDQHGTSDEGKRLDFRKTFKNSMSFLWFLKVPSIDVGSSWRLFWDHLGGILASCWYRRISQECCGADSGSRIKISGNLLGQNNQSFEIYPFDTSQVTNWGMAAEGEALTITSLTFASQLAESRIKTSGHLLG